MASYQCDLCGGETSFYRQSEKMRQCLLCGVVSLSPDLIPTNLNSYYENNIFYTENAKDPVSVAGMIRSARFYLSLLKKYIRPSGGQLLVDVGANFGILVEESIRQGFQAIGLEKNKSLILVGLERGLNISDTNLSELVTSNQVAVITAMHVLEHLTQPRSLINDAFQKLAVGGILMLGIPNMDSYLAQKDGLSWRYVALEHLYYFSPKTLSQILIEEGFEILAIKRDGTNLADLSLKKLLRYLIGGPLSRDRFQPKNTSGRQVAPTPKKNLFRLIIKNMIIFLIKILRREDFIVIVARKK